jgi:hypothetical protein
MNRISVARSLLLAASIVLAVLPCAAAEFHQEEFRIPFASGSGSYEALLVRPDEPGQYPLALINQGSPRSAADRPDMTPLSMLPEALEFARRGWAAVVVMRVAMAARTAVGRKATAPVTIRTISRRQRPPPPT